MSWTVWRSLWRGACFAAAAFALAGCAQSQDKVAIGIGTAAYTQQATRPYAVLYKPYAQMAAVAYADANKLRRSGVSDNVDRAHMVDAIHREGWSCLSGHVGPYGCKAGTPRCLNGLEYHVWRQGRCGKAVIAFRGSDIRDIGDWLTDFRWFIGRRNFDQYDQVQLAVFDIINSLRNGCPPNVIVTTGHSLGGGLAQHAAYADKRIAYVYAFDPSPVTAFFGIPLAKRDAAKESLGIDRIYEAGRDSVATALYRVGGVSELAMPTARAHCALRHRYRAECYRTASHPKSRHRANPDRRPLDANGQRPARLRACAQLRLRPAR